MILKSGALLQNDQRPSDRAKYKFVHGGSNRLKRALVDRIFWPWRQVHRACILRQSLPKIRSGTHLNFLHTSMFEATRNNEALECAIRTPTYC